MTNVPASVPLLLVNHALIARRRELYSQFGSIVAEDGTGSATVPMFLPPDGTLMTRLDPDEFSARSTHHVIDWRPAASTTSIAYGEGMLRGYLSLPAYDRLSSVVRWREDDIGAVAQAVIASFAWTGPDMASRNWHVLAPRGEEPLLRLPVLPRADLVPTSVPFVYTLTSLALDGGYPAIRGKLLGAWPDRGGGWPADGEAGRVVYRQLNPNVR